MRPVALLLALLAAACGAPDPGDEPVTASPAQATRPAAAPAPEPLPALRYYLDPAIAPAALPAVRAGVEGWATATRGVRAWTETDDAHGADLAIYVVGPYARLCDDGAYGCTRDIGGLWTHATGAGDPMPVFVTEGTYEPQATNVVEHELGHLLGLTHAPGGLMAADLPRDAPTFACPDAETIARLADELDVDGLTACALPD